MVMLSVAEAQRAVLDWCLAKDGDEVPLSRLHGLVLAQDVVSPLDSPPFDKSMMDGYAVRAEDVVTTPVTFQVLGEVTAGATFGGVVSPGTAVRIMTGATLPAGADAVVRIEETECHSGQVEIRAKSTPAGWNVIRRGAMFRRGETLLAEGRVLRTPELTLLAEIGVATATVTPRPTAAVLATGDELVPPGQPLEPGQIWNSNETLLLAQLKTFGADPVSLGIARDDMADLREKIELGLEQDILVLTGGVSMGSRDLVPQVLTELGVREIFHKVQLKPGKPAWFGVWPRSKQSRATLIFALPGNPVSTMVCSELFVRPAVERLARTQSLATSPIEAVLTREHRHCEDRPTYYPAWLEFGSSVPQVTPSGWRGSSDVRSTIDANSLLVLPPGERVYAVGERVSVLPFAEAVGSASEATARSQGPPGGGLGSG